MDHNFYQFRFFVKKLAFGTSFLLLSAVIGILASFYWYPSSLKSTQARPTDLRQFWVTMDSTKIPLISDKSSSA
jgi:hypothetical protein